MPTWNNTISKYEHTNAISRDTIYTMMKLKTVSSKKIVKEMKNEKDEKGAAGSVTGCGFHGWFCTGVTSFASFTWSGRIACGRASGDGAPGYGHGGYGA
jgi:hypothetical protein